MNEEKKIRVLIVDDEERFRITATKTLTKRGFEVADAANGIEALEELKKREIDVVILDVRMPGMDGNEVLPKILEVNPDVEVIMLTGHATMTSAFRAFQDNVYDYLAKPCDMDELAGMIRRAHGWKENTEEHSAA